MSNELTSEQLSAWSAHVAARPEPYNAVNEKDEALQSLVDLRFPYGAHRVLEHVIREMTGNQGFFLDDALVLSHELITQNVPDGDWVGNPPEPNK